MGDPNIKACIGFFKLQLSDFYPLAVLYHAAKKNLWSRSWDVTFYNFGQQLGKKSKRD